jgi:hypothetical protein
MRRGSRLFRHGSNSRSNPLGSRDPDTWSEYYRLHRHLDRRARRANRSGKYFGHCRFLSCQQRPSSRVIPRSFSFRFARLTTIGSNSESASYCTVLGRHRSWDSGWLGITLSAFNPSLEMRALALKGVEDEHSQLFAGADSPTIFVEEPYAGYPARTP